MKKLAPVFIMLIILIAFVSAVSAQSRIHNPDLPKGLVFQWRIVTESVHPTWSNEDFTINRTENGLVIYFGAFTTLFDAMSNIPTLPEGVQVADVSLVPFFNQISISAADAFVLMGNKNWFDMTGTQEEDAVSFTVYFDTYLTPISPYSVKNIEAQLSFEILPNRTFAYSAGEFRNLEEAEQFRSKLVSMGYEYAEVNKYLNGQKVALAELNEIYAFASYGW